MLLTNKDYGLLVNQYFLSADATSRPATRPVSMGIRSEV